MKDKQIPSPSAEPRIFLVSTLLHCVSMTALVYLRSSFGFAFLRPKSIFFALSWAFALYFAYAWIDGEVWQERRPVLLFFGGATVLYWLHLGVAFWREWCQSGEHDHYSGTSHPVWILRKVGNPPGDAWEAKLHLRGEPAVVLLTSVILRLIFAQIALSKCLLAVAICMWCKEALNHWFGVRQWKRQQDIFSDTEGVIETTLETGNAAQALKSVRKPRLERPRSKASEDSTKI